MSDEARLQYESKSRSLRADLKRWENDWAKAHGGRKPGRPDIKNNPDIAQKYKEYNRMREMLAGKPSHSPQADEPQAKKRKPQGPVPVATQTPVKRSKHVETPSKDRSRDEGLMNTPAISRKLFSPIPVTAVGPTPQKDGRVLGLFDLLVERELGTPSRRESSPRKQAAGRSSVLETPRKRAGPDLDSGGLGRTPMSSSKRQLLNTFLTPRKDPRLSTEGGGPTSVSKLKFDTPLFLKRHPLPPPNEHATFDAPAPLRLPRKPLVRGLSEIVASLRKVEEEVLDHDDDMEALREAEDAELGPTRPRTALAGDATTDESAGRRLLGGLDDEAMYDSPVEDAVDRHGNPLPVFKKKGQKRTTRRANMRPIWAKRPVKTSKGDGADGDEHAAPETQADAEAPGGDGSDAEFDGEAVAQAKAKPAPAKEGTVKKAARKVNELAHANFQRLKLRNSGAKGGPAHNSRFRRRR